MSPLRGSRTLRTFFYRDVTPTGFKDLADVFLQRCHPYGVQGPCGRFSTEMSPLRGSRTLRTFFYRDVTPTGFKDLADVFLQRCHPYGVQETFAERVCRDLQQIPRNVPKLTSMVRLGTVPTGPGEYAVRNADRIWASTPQNCTIGVNLGIFCSFFESVKGCVFSSTFLKRASIVKSLFYGFQSFAKCRF